MNPPWTNPKNLPDNKYDEFKTLSFLHKIVVWVSVDISESLAEKILDFMEGFKYFGMSLYSWFMIMITDYEISNKKLFGLTWFDTFYGELGRGYAQLLQQVEIEND